MMFKFAIIIAGLAAFTLAESAPSDDVRRDPAKFIVGGSAISIQEAPYQVGLQVLGRGFYCGGSIISKDWIVTAGHCSDFPASYYTVRAGSTYQSYGGSTHRVSSVHRHPSYWMDLSQHSTPNNDIGLMRVSTPFTLDSTRQIVPLFDSGEKAAVGAIAFVSGWGWDGVRSPSNLHAVSVPIISTSECQSKYKNWADIMDGGEICAAYSRGGKDACTGDSGGPMVIGGKLAGIVSWGDGCAKPGRPGVYAEVAHYRSWIKQYTGV